MRNVPRITRLMMARRHRAETRKGSREATTSKEETKMTRIFVNGYGWIMGGNTEVGLRFTKSKIGAKPFTGSQMDSRSELFSTVKYIEMTMKCNYDLVV